MFKTRFRSDRYAPVTKTDPVQNTTGLESMKRIQFAGIGSGSETRSKFFPSGE